MPWGRGGGRLRPRGVVRGNDGLTLAWLSFTCQNGLLDGVRSVAMHKDVRLCVWICVSRVCVGGGMKGCHVWQLSAVPLRKERGASLIRV